MNRRKAAPKKEGIDGRQDQGSSTAIAGEEPSAMKSENRAQRPQSLHLRSNSQEPLGKDNIDPDVLPDEIVLERAKPSSSDKRRPSYTVRAPGTPFHELDLSEIPWLGHEAADVNVKRGLMRYRRLFFLAGILAGALCAWALSQHVVFESHLQNIRSVVDEQLSSMGVDLSNFDLSLKLPGEFSELANNLFSGPREWIQSRDFSVGRQLYLEEGVKAKHPVVLLPGIISTGLESWSTGPDTSGYFRKRLWGTTTMMRTIVLEKVRGFL